MAIEVTTYNVGQGLFNLLVETDSVGNHFCGLIDCGTIAAASKESVDGILDDASERINQIGHLDFIVISHQDKDHWSLLLKLLGKIYSDSSVQSKWLLVESQKLIRLEEKRSTIKLEFFKSSDRYECVIDDLAYRSQISVSYSIGGPQFVLDINDNLNDENDSEYHFFHMFGYEWDDKYYFEIKLDKYKKALCFVKDTEEDVKNTVLQCIRENEYAAAITKAMSTRFERLWEKRDEVKKYDEYKSQAISRTIHDTQIYLGGRERTSGYVHLQEVLQLFGKVECKDNGVLYISKNDSFKHYRIGVEEVLLGNENQKISQNAILRNATSLMAVYTSMENEIFFFPGDATIHTFYAFTIVEFISINYMTAPHHGSYNTNFVIDDEGQIAENQPVKQFIEQHSPDVVVFSAKHDKFGHPNYQVQKFMHGYAKIGKHKIIQCCDITNTKTEIVDYGTITTETTGTCHYPDALFKFRNGEEVKTLQKKEIPSDKYFL